MVKKKAKIISLIIACILIVSMITGCVTTKSEGEKEETPKTTTEGAKEVEPFKGEFEVFVMEHEQIPGNPDWEMFRLLEEKIGVKIKYTGATGEVFTTRYNLMVASGTLPDMVYTNTSEINSLVNVSDVFEPANKNFDKTPNYKKIHDKYFETGIKYNYSVDGNLYIYNNITDHEPVPYYATAPGIRKDIFDKHNIPVPTTWDEVYEALKKLKDEYPETYPFASRSGVEALVGGAFTYMWGTGPILYKNAEKNTFVVGPTEDNFRKMIEWLSKIYAEEILDPEFLTMGKSELREKMMGFGRPAFFIIDNSGLEGYEKVASDRDPNQIIDLKLLLPPEVSPGVKGKLISGSRVQNSGYSVSAYSKNKEAVYRYIDFAYSDEGAEFCSFGPEELEVGIKVNGGIANGGYYLINPKWEGTSNVNGDFYQALLGVRAHPFRMREWSSEETRLNDKNRNDYEEKLVANNQILPYWELPLFIEMEREEYNDINSKVQSIALEYATDFILGEKNISAEWENFIKQLKDVGADRLVEICNTADARMSK